MTHMTTICHVRLPKLANSPAKVCRNCMYDTSRLWAAGYKKKTPAAEKVCSKSLSVHSMPRGGRPPVVTKRYGARQGRVPYSLLP